MVLEKTLYCLDCLLPKHRTIFHCIWTDRFRFYNLIISYLGVNNYFSSKRNLTSSPATKKIIKFYKNRMYTSIKIDSFWLSLFFIQSSIFAFATKQLIYIFPSFVYFTIQWKYTCEIECFPCSHWSRRRDRVTWRKMNNYII